MPKPSRKTIEPLLDEWARLKARANKIEKSRDMEIAPLKERFEKQCAHIHSQKNEQLRPLNDKLTTLSTEISKQLLAGVSDDGSIALSQVEVEGAIAEVKTKEGAREIDPEKFFEFTPPAKRDPRFWKCMRVLVAPAEKFLGDVIDKMAKKPKSHSVDISLKA